MLSGNIGSCVSILNYLHSSEIGCHPLTQFVRVVNQMTWGSMTCTLIYRSYQWTRVCPFFSLTCRRLRSTCKTMDKVHVVSKEGFKQGKHYDQSRPSYTDEITLCVVKNLYKGTDTGLKYNILELGAGTGKFTRKLQPHVGQDFSYLASDPSDQFLTVLKEQSPNVETKVFSAFDIPLPDNSVQNIVCAQCFHWCANNECLDEIARVLVPKGRLLCVWNHKRWDIDWVKEAEDILTTYYMVETPRAYLKKWQVAIGDYQPMKCVEHLELAGIPNMKGDKEFVVDHFGSISVISLLNAEDNKKARAKFRAMLDKHFQDEQEIQIPFFSEFYCAEKI